MLKVNFSRFTEHSVNENLISNTLEYMFDLDGAIFLCFIAKNFGKDFGYQMGEVFFSMNHSDI